MEFSKSEDGMEINLSKEMSQAELEIANKGPLLSKNMQGRFFESMVSVRKQDKKSKISR